MSVDPYRPARLRSVAQAALAFAAGLSVPLGIVALIPEVPNDYVSNRSFALLVAVFLAPTPFVHLFAYIRQLTTYPDAVTRARLGTSFVSGLAFTLGWIPLIYLLALLLGLLDNLRLSLPTDGVATVSLLTYWFLGPLFLPFPVGRLLMKSGSRNPSGATA